MFLTMTEPEQHAFRLGPSSGVSCTTSASVVGDTSNPEKKKGGTQSHFILGGSRRVPEFVPVK